MATETYTVKKGDTLSKIAKKYGMGSWKTLYNAKENAKFRKLRPDPDLIYPGDKIEIPSTEPTKPPKLNHKKSTKRMDFEIRGEKGRIWVRQTWHYTYTNLNGASKWTGKEKKDFHAAIEKSIRSAWNGKFSLKVEGTSDFAKYYKGKTLKVFFDVDPVGSGGHWEVIARKIPKGDDVGSSVNWGKQVIKIDTEDMNPEDKGAPSGTKQNVAAHEFGHAMGNATGSGAGHADEYKSSSAFKNDKESIMSMGMEVRKRHADYLVVELNKIVPDTTFIVASVN